MKALLWSIMLVLGIVFSPLLYAQSSADSATDVNELENSPAEDAEAKQAQQKQKTSSSKKPATSAEKKSSTANDQKAKSTASTSKNKATNKVFIPTEEISEDKPVAFPVDI